MRVTILPLALAASACMAGSLPTGGLDAADAPPASCTATEAQQFIGRKASSSIGRGILDMSKSRKLRWGGPDSVFTMDYRKDRVNVIYDANGIITRIYCG
ncbi:hypothetical protein K3178_02030 [Qipengyuania sp. GH29]|nr:hypothetical protein [Qipengyuania sphaerica]